jgi:hypothetical protein
VEVPAVGATRPMLGYTFTIENTSGGLVVNATLDVSDSRVPASATISNLMLRRLGGGHAPSPTIPIWTDATCQWPIGNVDAGARYELSYQAERTSP